MFMLGGGDIEATRQVAERALTAAGTHVAEGVLVWQVVLLVEKQVGQKGSDITFVYSKHRVKPSLGY